MLVLQYKNFPVVAEGVVDHGVVDAVAMPRQHGIATPHGDSGRQHATRSNGAERRQRYAVTHQFPPGHICRAHHLLRPPLDHTPCAVQHRITDFNGSGDRFA